MELKYLSVYNIDVSYTHFETKSSKSGQMGISTVKSSELAHNKPDQYDHLRQD
jgi:hypothetical protein